MNQFRLNWMQGRKSDVNQHNLFNCLDRNKRKSNIWEKIHKKRKDKRERKRKMEDKLK